MLPTVRSGSWMKAPGTGRIWKRATGCTRRPAAPWTARRLDLDAGAFDGEPIQIPAEGLDSLGRGGEPELRGRHARLDSPPGRRRAAYVDVGGSGRQRGAVAARSGPVPRCPRVAGRPSHRPRSGPAERARSVGLRPRARHAEPAVPRPGRRRVAGLDAGRPPGRLHIGTRRRGQPPSCARPTAPGRSSGCRRARICSGRSRGRRTAARWSSAAGCGPVQADAQTLDTA